MVKNFPQLNMFHKIKLGMRLKVAENHREILNVRKLNNNN